MARQGLPLRGHGDERDSNFFLLRGEDDSRVAEWLSKKTDKYTAPDIQNEILKIMALSVLRSITAAIHSSPFLSVMIDETTNVFNKEQVVVCIR